MISFRVLHCLGFLLLWLPTYFSLLNGVRMNGTVLASLIPTEQNNATQPAPEEWKFSNLQPCTRTSLELRQLKREDNIEPCILVDLQPNQGNHTNNNDNDNAMNNYSNRSAVLTLIMITNHFCINHRDGALTSVEALNGDNDGRGIAIGFHQDFYVQFRFVSVIAGNSDALGDAMYGQRHTALLKDMLEQLQPQYIVGTCSSLAENEKEPARLYQTILMAAVGPPGFYRPPADGMRNPWIFGIHINSDLYPLDNVRRLTFYWSQEQEKLLSNAKTTPEEFSILRQDPNYLKKKQPIRVIYRTKSEFFYSTCASAIRALQQAGFEDIMEILFDHTADHDGDNVTNQFDADYLHGLADQACPAIATKNLTFYNTTHRHPALFICTSTEHDLLLERLRENACQPFSLWLTASTWTWALEHNDTIPYFQGASQWHAAFTYGDRFFNSGVDVLEHIEKRFGYKPDYDSVVQYAIPSLFAQHLQASYRVEDDPDPLADFSDPDGREHLRRQMITFVGETIFGPVAFDQDQRNSGRDAAATQWLPSQQSQFSNDTNASSTSFYNALISPIYQAEASPVLPSPTAVDCPAGSFVDQLLIQNQSAILSKKCSLCPVNTYTSNINTQVYCTPCPDGTTTEGQGGALYCTRYDDTLLDLPVLSYGFVMMSISWLLAVTFIVWIIKYRKDAIVRLAQVEFLILFCLGAIISSSTIWVLSMQIPTGDDTRSATRACQAAPFLYTTGWILQYSSLCSKTWRLYQIMKSNLRRVKVTALQTSFIVFLALAVDISIVTAWNVLSPPVYSREVTYERMEGDIRVIASVGQCRPAKDGKFSVWVFVIPILVHHAILMLGTNYLLYCVRNVHSRYQESKYMVLASLFVLEVIVVGLPVMLAAQESISAAHVVQCSVIALADIGVLCFIFLPKVFYQRKGLAEGIGVGESIMVHTHQKAKLREQIRHSMLVPSDRSNSFFLGMQDPSQMGPESSIGAFPSVHLGKSVISEVIQEEDSDSSSSFLYDDETKEQGHNAASKSKDEPADEEQSMEMSKEIQWTPPPPSPPPKSSKANGRSTKSQGSSKVHFQLDPSKMEEMSRIKKRVETLKTRRSSSSDVESEESVEHGPLSKPSGSSSEFNVRLSL